MEHATYIWNRKHIKYINRIQLDLKDRKMGRNTNGSGRNWFWIQFPSNAHCLVQPLPLPSFVSWKSCEDVLVTPWLLYASFWSLDSSIDRISACFCPQWIRQFQLERRTNGLSWHDLDNPHVNVRQCDAVLKCLFPHALVSQIWFCLISKRGKEKVFLWSPQERHSALMSLLATARGGVDMRQSIMQVWRMAEELGR